MTALAGTTTLTRLALRRDRLLVPAWVATFAAVVGFSALASKDLYRTTAELVRVSEGWNATTALVALHGRIYDTASLGAGSMVKMTGLGTALLALLSGLLVIRHTRADEEVGRTELAAGGVVGRYAALAAALLIAVGSTLAIGVACGLALVAAGLPAAGAAAFAAAWAAVGLVFAGVGAVAAQLATSARAARGLVAAALGVAYAVRAVGDTAPEGGARWLSWLSPLGWTQQVRPFAGDRWWALAVPAVVGPLLILAAAALQRSRDLGAAMLGERPGPARAPGLRTAWALAWRLQRPAFTGWLIGTVLMGALLGSIASTIEDLFDVERFREYLELLGGVEVLQDAFLSTELGMVALFVSAYGVSAALRLHSEEAQGRAESVLTAGAGRVSFAGAHLTLALAGTAGLLAAAGLGIGLSHAASVGDPAQVGRLVGAALARLPAVWVTTAATVALFGLAGRLAPLAWALLVGFVVVGEFGPLMELPSWTLDLSPYTHLSSLPGGAFQGVSALVMTGLAALLGGLGLLAFAHRDLQPG